METGIREARGRGATDATDGPRAQNPHRILAWIPASIAGLAVFYMVVGEWVDGIAESSSITLIAEIAVGITVSILLLWAARRNEQKLQSKVSEVQDNLTEVVDGRAKRQAQAYAQISRSLHAARPIIEDIMEIYRMHDACGPGTLQDAHRSDILELHGELAEISGGGLDRVLDSDGEHLYDRTYETAADISSRCKSRPNFAGRNRVAGPEFYDRLLADITDAATNLMGVFDEYPEERDFTVASDRSVYPVGGRIHIEVNMPEAEPGAPIRLEIFDSRNRLMDVKIINVGPARPLDPDHGLYGTSFRMSGERWEPREQYTVRATYGSRHEEDGFTIEQRRPLVQTDKSVYMAGHDMIITVIDPDSDRDSGAAEYVGDRADSKLVIETDSGRIDGYRLEETGPSTGIFQGIVGILGVREDGSVVPYDTGDGPVGRTQGTGIDDGYIAARPGSEITITYRFGSGSVQETCVVSDMPLSMQLDGGGE